MGLSYHSLPHIESSGKGSVTVVQGHSRSSKSVPIESPYHAKNKMMSVRSGPVPLSWGSPVGKRNLWWKEFVEKVGFEPGLKEWWMTRLWMMTEMSWEVDEEVNRDENDEADGMNSGSWFQRRGDAYLNKLCGKVAATICPRPVTLTFDLLTFWPWSRCGSRMCQNSENRCSCHPEIQIYTNIFKFQQVFYVTIKRYNIR